MIMEILTGSGGILSYLQDIRGGGFCPRQQKRVGGFCPGGILSYTRFHYSIETKECASSMDVIDIS